MSTSFTFLSSSLPRLAALRHALDIGTSGPLAHVCIRANGDTATITATDGRLLAIVRLAPGDFDGVSAEVVVDGTQFSRACGTLDKTDHASVVRVVIQPEDHEVRLTRGTAVAVARILNLVYPVRADFLDKYQGQHLVPSIATFVPSLIATASRIIGARKVTMMLWSPCPDPELASCWSRDPDAHAPVSQDTISLMLRQPGIWTDGRELLVFLMPMTRSSTGAPELVPFISHVSAVEMTSSAA